jgi:hypothetical protein
MKRARLRATESAPSSKARGPTARILLMTVGNLGAGLRGGAFGLSLAAFSNVAQPPLIPRRDIARLT